ncbi:hypothetical protein E1162_05860 [Rhodobacteraceae bacterium RKSG542]|uniref:rod-binding protein n=1 Tax=Pseudovibrio flavus TaxID=2529854 RepID=UPI0012BBB111|nr:rod-binding protein [Pseudovibrio flavus]MTI16758.1 hypothetical protein [Pseudovibrio flavus]
MAVQPVGDIILDVLKGADPLARAEATSALSRPTKVAADLPTLSDPGGFSAAMDSALERVSSVSRSGVAFTGSASETVTAMKNLSATAPAGRDLGQELEAAILHTLVESMMPKDMASIYGGGTAGNTYKSMLAEQLANKIADSGGIGLADMLVTDELLNQSAKKEA